MREHVLVVDDEPAIRAILSDFLLELGYMVETATHGADALEKLARQSFGAILLDLMMPVMDGREFLRRLRDDLTHTALPVLVISAAPLDQVQKTAELGAAGWIQKPFELEALASALGRIVGQSVCDNPAHDGD